MTEHCFRDSNLHVGHTSACSVSQKVQARYHTINSNAYAGRLYKSYLTKLIFLQTQH